MIVRRMYVCIYKYTIAMAFSCPPIFHQENKTKLCNEKEEEERMSFE